MLYFNIARSTSPDLCASFRAARQANHAEDSTMQHARKRLIIVAPLLALLLTVSPAASSEYATIQKC
jgi:hypothetical protein